VAVAIELAVLLRYTNSRLLAMDRLIGGYGAGRGALATRLPLSRINQRVTDVFDV
jgi:hypothetical protein